MSVLHEKMQEIDKLKNKLSGTVSENYIMLFYLAHFTDKSSISYINSPPFPFSNKLLVLVLYKLPIFKQIDDLHVRLTFNLGKTKKIFYHS